MTTCARCVHWQMTEATPLVFRRGSAASCEMGDSFTYIHATKTCRRFRPTVDAVIDERRQIVRAAKQEPGNDGD
jgi:hypothetical protein